MADLTDLIERLEKFDWWIHTSEGKKRTDIPYRAAAALRTAHNDAIEDAAKECAGLASHMGDLIDNGKGEHGRPGYVRDDTWARWHGELSAAERLAAAIRNLRKDEE